MSEQQLRRNAENYVSERMTTITGISAAAGIITADLFGRDVNSANSANLAGRNAVENNLNFITAGGVSVVAGSGKEASSGLATNIETGEQATFASVGDGNGLNVSSDVFLGFVSGDLSNVGGHSKNLNLGAGWFSLTLIRDLSGETIGWTFGVGPGVAHVAGSVTNGETILRRVDEE